MKLILSPAVSLDGYLADSNGECYNWIIPADEERYEQELLQVGCELIGRKTYELRKEYYNSRTKILTFVYTSNPVEDIFKIRFISGSPKDVLQKIENIYGLKTVITCGGGDTLGAFAMQGLANELFLSFHSITLGTGVPLFGKYKPKLKLSYIDVDTSIPGVTRLYYKVL